MVKKMKKRSAMYMQQSKKLATYRAPALAQADHVWSTFVSTFVSYSVHRKIYRQTDKMNDESHYSAILGGVKIERWR